VSVIFAAHAWKNNAELITACHALGYLKDDDKVLDPTCGRGRWWTQWKPADLTTHDVLIDDTDFRDLSDLYDDHAFDAIAYDPPYVPRGGQTASARMQDFNERYGRVINTTPASIQQLIDDGLTEMVRLVKPKGIILVKCQSYIWAGKYWPGAHYTLAHGLDLGCTLVDQFQHVTSPRPQPPRTRKDGKLAVQQHARNNYSTLLVLGAPA
jgi:hypothetical protein